MELTQLQNEMYPDFIYHPVLSREEWNGKQRIRACQVYEEFMHAGKATGIFLPLRMESNGGRSKSNASRALGL